MTDFMTAFVAVDPMRAMGCVLIACMAVGYPVWLRTRRSRWREVQRLTRRNLGRVRLKAEYFVDDGERKDGLR